MVRAFVNYKYSLVEPARGGHAVRGDVVFSDGAGQRRAGCGARFFCFFFTHGLNI